MACPVSVSLIRNDHRTPARNFRRIVTASVVLLAAAASACTKPQPPKSELAKSEPANASRLHPWTVMGEGLPLCTPDMTSRAVQVIRIYVFQSLDKIFDPTPVPKPIFYGPLPESPADRVKYDFAPAGLTRLNSNDPSVQSNVYNSDLTVTGLNPPALVEYRIILENGLGSSMTAGNMQYYTDSANAPVAIRGVAVNKANLPDFVCSNNVIDEANLNNTTTHAIVDFYAKLNQSTGTYVNDGFNVVIVPKAGNTGTPVMIDPKIRNNG